MKSSQFIIFISIVTVVYLAVNYYIFIRGFYSIPQGNHLRLWYSLTFWFLVSTYIIARILDRTCPGTISYIFTWIGSFWMAAMLFFIVAVILFDLLRIVFLIFPSLHHLITSSLHITRLHAFLFTLISVFITIAAGYFNARHPRLRQLDITVHKKVEGLKELNIALVSDIHLGTIIGKDKANKLVNQVNDLHPDLILLAGDVVDEDIAPVIKENTGEALCRLKATYGVYAITGNHEYIGGVDAAVKYLEEHCITMLRDTSVLVQDKFYLVGRDDRDKSRFTGKPRKELSLIMEGIDRSRPVILMDHQPFSLSVAEKLGVDLQLSGHTHHGQIWPLNYVTNAIYELSWGYRQMGETHYYVSCGYGTWGPPVRVGNRPEVVSIRIRFGE